MSKQHQLASIIFLEDWIIANSNTTTTTTITTTTTTTTTTTISSSSSSAQTIIQSWAELRNSIKERSFGPRHVESLKSLLEFRGSIFVAEPQARVLVSILLDEDISVPFNSYPLFFRLLYIWVRKSPSKIVSSIVVDSIVDVISRVFENGVCDVRQNGLFSEIVLLLGAISAARALPEGIKHKCLDLLCRVLEERRGESEIGEIVVPEVVAGIGYSFSWCDEGHFTRIVDFLFRIWDKKEGSCNVSHGLMILHLMEWVVFGFIDANSVGKIEIFVSRVLGDLDAKYAWFAVLMAAAGALRASSRSAPRGGMQQIVSKLRSSAEALLEAVAVDLMLRISGQMEDSGVGFLLQCFSLAMARCGVWNSKRGSLLVCLASALLIEIFPLKRFYAMIRQCPIETLSGLEPNVVKEHQDSILFKEAGAVAGVLCNLYASAHEDDKRDVENLIWTYCLDIYRGHRQVAFVLRGHADGLLGDLEKIAGSVFLTVVVFALAVAKQRLTSKFSRDIKMRISVDILISFSCMEYFRRVNVPEYLDTIKPVIASFQEHESGCEAFVATMPSYSELINPEGFPCLPSMKYLWSQDEVQTARMLFYLRVIPTSIDNLPSTTFRTMVASTMFLYMGHQNVKVARAAHSTFVSFISSGKDHGDDERVQLKEQLVFYYMIRSLEVKQQGYPGKTPFEGLASGVAAIVRHLPAGSPSIFYCIHSLVKRANALYEEVANQEAKSSWKHLQGDTERAKKIVGLLTQLLALVDIQVLPELMKLLAQLILKLPKDGQTMVLNDLYALIAESDDVTRKPASVSWLQSLSFLCSQDTAPIAARL